MVVSRGLLITLACVLPARGSQSKRLVCETTVRNGDGVLEIELWPTVAPNGVQRVVELVEDGFFNDLPFFRAIQGFLIQFGISPSAEMQRRWNKRGNIVDDPHPSPPIAFTDGIVSFAGYGRDSRSTHLFLTLGSQPGLGKSPWEVPVGRVAKGIDVLHAIYTGYGDRVDQGRLDPTRGHGATAYLEGFPKLDRFRSCRVESEANAVPSGAAVEL